MFNFFKSNKKGKQNQKSKIKNILIGFLLLVFVFTSFGIFNQKENKNKIVNFIFGIEQVEAEKTVEEIQKEITAIDEKIKETDASNFTEIDKLKAQKKTLTQELAVAEGKGTTDSWKLKED